MRYRTMFATTAALALVLLSGPGASAQSDMLPKRKGDSATLQQVGGTDSAHVAVLKARGNWQQLSILAGIREPVWVWYSKRLNKAWIFAGRRIQFFADFGKQGGSARLEIGGQRGMVTVSAVNRVIATPAGIFQGCVELSFRGFAVSRAWFAPGVGCVRWVDQAGETFEVIDARVGRDRYPADHGMKVCAVIPHSVVVNAKPPLPARVPRVTIRASLTNRSPRSISVVTQVGRPTIQVVITNARGVVVTTQQPAIRAAFVPVDMKSGVSGHISLDVQLRDDTQMGRPALPAGEYKVRVNIGGHWAAGGSLHVSWAL